MHDGFLEPGRPKDSEIPFTSWTEVDLDLPCDLHLHTSYTDGKGNVADMASAAQAAGMTRILLSDHVRRVRLQLLKRGVSGCCGPHVVVERTGGASEKSGARLALTLPATGASGALFDLSHVSDVAHTIGRAVGHEEAALCNVGNSGLTGVVDLAEACAAAIGVPVKIEAQPKEHERLILNWVDDFKVRSELGHRNRVTLTDGITEIADYCRNVSNV